MNKKIIILLILIPIILCAIQGTYDAINWPDVGENYNVTHEIIINLLLSPILAIPFIIINLLIYYAINKKISKGRKNS